MNRVNPVKKLRAVPPACLCGAVLAKKGYSFALPLLRALGALRGEMLFLDLYSYEEEINLPYINSAAQYGMKKGLEPGQQDGTNPKQP